MYILAAVGGWADLVWDADTTLAGETSSDAIVNTLDTPSRGLEAIACRLFISRGLCRLCE